VPEQIHADYMQILQRWHHWIPPGRRGAKAVQEQHNRCAGRPALQDMNVTAWKAHDLFTRSLGGLR
jgi:hypothetical protein